MVGGAVAHPAATLPALMFFVRKPDVKPFCLGYAQHWAQDRQFGQIWWLLLPTHRIHPYRWPILGLIYQTVRSAYYFDIQNYSAECRI